MNPAQFIPGTTLQFDWSASSLSLLITCPRKYYYSKIEDWRKISDSVHLEFGGIFASSVETYHKLRAAGQDHDEALDGTVAHAEAATWEFPSEEDLAQGADPEGKPWTPDHNAKNRSNLLRSVIWYLEEYKDDVAQTLILADGTPGVELPFRFELDAETASGLPYMLNGKLDRVVSFAGDTYVMDQKTTGTTLSTHYFKQFAPDIQMSLYTLASKIAFDTKVSGVIIDAAQIAVGFTAFARGITMRSQAQLEEWLANTKAWFKLAERFAETESYPMNLSSCGNYGGCPFRDVCSSEPRIRPNILQSQFKQQTFEANS